MTRAEITELFAVLVIAYPNADMFKAPSQQQLKEKLAPTITLWATCLRDVDFWTGQQAVVEVCKTCKFPPTIAEMRECCMKVTEDTRKEISNAYLTARSLYQLYGREKFYESLPARARKTVDAMGGVDAFAPPGGTHFAMSEFERTYEGLLRSNPVGLPGGGGQRAALPE